MSDPTSTIRPLERGLRHLTHERVDEAIVALEEAVRDDPRDAAAYAFLAAALFAAARPGESEAAIDRALTLDPDGYWPHLKAGELRFRLGDGAAAEPHLLVALRAAEPGSRESEVAAAALVRARQAKARSITHRAILPARFRRALRRSTAPVGAVAPQANNGAP
jgi:tetratricopeptide (TPR) repeat protein